MALKGHEYIRQTLERYAHRSRKDEKLHGKIEIRETGNERKTPYPATMQTIS